VVDVTPPLPRVGLGYDVHQFSDDPDRPFVLAGVTVEGQTGLVGHSDADAAAHAVADALLGAAGLGDIGQHFPDDDEQWKNADSMMLLRAIALRVQAAGFEIGNVDCTVITEAPKLAPIRDEMEKNLSSAIDAPVSVKATRPESLGALGRGEGLACLAVALIVPVER
jgi:2-C-methyl-D-erythritol 2,4-cyclodiphosphate synthase